MASKALQIVQQKETNMQQLTLWDTEPSPSDQTDIDSSSNRDIIIMPTNWADGDKRPEQLERLALGQLGELVGALKEEASGLTLLNYHLDREALKASRRKGYTRLLYRVISTGIVGDQVLCACEYLCTHEDFFGKGSALPDDELEDVA